MGTFCISCKVVNHTDRTKSRVIPRLLVDTGSEYTWIAETTLRAIGIEPEKKIRLMMANGSVLEREVGFALLLVGKGLTTDEVVFAQRGDLLLLGARTLEGLNVCVDLQAKKLIEAGPSPAAPLAGYSDEEAREHRKSFGAARVYPHNAPRAGADEPRPLTTATSKGPRRRRKAT